MTLESIDFSNLERAIQTLGEAMARPPANSLERDGAIQRFEYSFELLWKMAKRVLETLGLQANSPKAVIRELVSQDWIENGDLWMSFLKARNATSHIYKEEIANDVFRVASQFLPESRALIARLKQEAGR